jgi:hypothetical protein
MPAVKKTTVTFLILPEIKAALREAAEREHRSLANMLEIMIREWCGREGVGPVAYQLATTERRQ